MIYTMKINDKIRNVAILTAVSQILDDPKLIETIILIVQECIDFSFGLLNPFNNYVYNDMFDSEGLSYRTNFKLRKLISYEKRLSS